MEKEEKIEKNNNTASTNVSTNAKDNIVEPVKTIKKEVQKPEIVSEKRCIKCNNLISTKDKFCYICGADQTKVPVVKPKKKQSSFGVLNLFLVLLLLLIFFAGALFIWRYFDSSSNHINYSNKRVTVDDTGIADAVEKVYDSVVVVENYNGGRLYGTGSGFVYKTDNNYGYILTHNHVIAGATELNIKFTNNKTDKAEVVGNDDFSDVAVLKVAKKNIVQVAEIGDNNKMRVGDTTFAVGTPLDAKTYSWSVTRGILSGKNRVVSSGSTYMNVLQTDTPINSGNSGGPLCNANGEVIGITNMKLASDQIEGMGFAIPIETAIDYANSFISGTKVDRPYVGVSIYDASQSFFSNEIYVVVDGVEADSPADKAGIKKGDIIVKLNDEKIDNSSHFKYKLYSHKVGETVNITVKRDNKEVTLKVKLESGTRKKA